MENAFRFTTEAQGSSEPWPSGAFPGWRHPSIDGAVADPLNLEGVLPQEIFMERLRFEKRRVDRSGAPLSMALFFMKEELLADVKKLRKFLLSIKRATRETDLKGWVNGSTFGLLMLDTDGSGAQKCVELLVNGQSKSFCDLLTGTYPDRLFTEILHQGDFPRPGHFPADSPGQKGKPLQLFEVPVHEIRERRPGPPGIWQVEGRSRTSFDDVVRLDIRHVQNWSLWLDLKILAKTVREVLMPKGGL